MNILIIKTGALGDVLRTTSILKPLLNKYEGANIVWLTKKNAYDLLKNNRYISKILFIEDTKAIDIEFDLIVSLDDEELPCKIASETESKRLIGSYYDKEKGICTYTEEGKDWFGMGLLRPKEVGGIEKANELKAKNKKTVQEHLLAMLNLEKKDNEIILELGKENIDFAAKFAKKHGLDDNKTRIGMNTGAGGRWQLKRMHIKNAVGLADKLDKTGAKIILLGGPEEKERNEKIKSDVSFDIINAKTDNSILDFAAIVGLCDIVVTSDSLCLHIALALGKKVVAFFGPTSSAEIEMYGRGIKIVPEMGCVCCYKKVCEKSPCCTEMISNEEILEAVKNYPKNK